MTDTKDTKEKEKEKDLQEGMKCGICNVVKLSGDFPREISPDCEHIPTYCLKCALEEFKTAKTCLYPKCPVKIDSKIKETLQKEYEATIPHIGPTATIGGYPVALPPQKVTITLLDGTRFEIPTKGDKEYTLGKLQDAIATEKKYPRPRQELYFNNQALKDAELPLVKYGITNESSSLQLVIIMSPIIEKGLLVFDLHWGYPDSGKDFLDGSCLVFNEKMEKINVLDYKNREKGRIPPGTDHSGDVMSEEKKEGHHKIHVKLQELPEDVHRLFFVLSSWNATSLDAYKEPRVGLYQTYPSGTGKPDEVLCVETFDNKTSRALIVCCLYRVKSRTGWRVTRLGVMSDGSAKNYSPIIETIKDGKKIPERDISV